MDIQTILVFVIFALAIGYVGKLIYGNLKPNKNGCSTGCGKCGVDFSKVEIPDKK